jgi:IS1 family transposase/transposase-like protein
MLVSIERERGHPMIAITCRRCGSVYLRKNGHTPSGQQKFHCQDCNAYGTLDTKDEERAHKQATVEKLHLEHFSQRAIARTTGLSRMSVAAILKKVLTPISETIRPLGDRLILELNELWSFVGQKGNQVWILVALERQTRRIVGLAFGDRSAESCRKLWESLAADYRKRAICYRDFLASYAAVLPSKRHRAVGKETGQTAHIERFNNTLRQRCANLVRKSLSFSKDERWHELLIRLFIDHYNRQLEQTGRLAPV